MTGFSFLIAAALSADALGIGAAYGIRGIKISKKSCFMIFAISLIITGSSFLAGQRLAKYMPNMNWSLTGGLILIGMGIWLLAQSFRDGTANPMNEPHRCDLDCSQTIEPIEALYLGIIMSADSIGAGFGMGTSIKGYEMLPLIIAAFQIIFLTVGLTAGEKLKPIMKKESIGNIMAGI